MHVRACDAALHSSNRERTGKDHRQRNQARRTREACLAGTGVGCRAQWWRARRPARRGPWRRRCRWPAQPRSAAPWRRTGRRLRGSAGTRAIRDGPLQHTQETCLTQSSGSQKQQLASRPDREGDECLPWLLAKKQPEQLNSARLWSTYTAPPKNRAPLPAHTATHKQRHTIVNHRQLHGTMGRLTREVGANEGDASAAHEDGPTEPVAPAQRLKSNEPPRHKQCTNTKQTLED